MPDSSGLSGTTWRSLAVTRLNRVQHLASNRLVRHDLQRRLQMRYRFIVSAKFDQKHSQIAMNCRLLRFERERFLVLANRFVIETPRFLWDSRSRLAQTVCSNC